MGDFILSKTYTVLPMAILRGIYLLPKSIPQKIFRVKEIILILILIAIYVSIFAKEANNYFNFKRYLTGPLQTISVQIENINYNTGEVVVGGYDSQCPTIAFTWDWGNGTINNGFFPWRHTYSDLTKNYLVRVTAHYSDGGTDTTEITIRFVSPAITTTSLSPDIAVSIPDSNITLISRMPGYGTSGLTYFDNSFFYIIPRSTTEYILTVAASIQKDLVNDDVYLINGGFKQVLLRDPPFGGMYSLWYTIPVSFGVGDYGFQGTIQWSSFMHEMGHNFSLNSPADYYYGGKMDGNANAIFSESMAQIFQHATAYEIINNAGTYGLSEDIIADIKQSAISSIKIVRSSYEDYVNSGKSFASWNDPNTPQDETFNTFMTIAYQFFIHAENSGLGYRQPLKRMMKLLQTFNEDLRQQYDQHHNTTAADTFRATLMTTAVGYGFGQDLRDEFRSLNFPISDVIYGELINLVNTAPIVATMIEDTTIALGEGNYVRDLNAFPPVFNDADDDSLSYSAVSSDVSIATTHILGSVLTISPVSVGAATITITANDGENASVSTSLQVTVISPVGIEIQSSNIPEDYDLLQNFPNPFNPFTKIQFTLRKEGHVLLKIFDIMGREIAVLVDNKLQAGTYIYNWNATNLPNGVYFYRLQAGSFKQTKKLILMK